MALQNLAALLDHTLLRPEATKAEVLRLCEEARRYGLGAIFIHPCYLDLAVAAVAGTATRVGVPIGFPFGSQTTNSKISEAVEARERGAVELDMVLNISRLKSGEYDAVQAEIAEVVQATPGAGHKVILETCYLTKQEKMLACRLVVEAGAEYVKTSTGFGSGGATVEDVRLLKEAVAGRAKVKASGGIRDLKTVLALLEAGADRIGTSASVQIMEEWLKEPSRKLG
ncbi:MAG: deoxyribose-phosphate aldolase [Nitrospiraceae bacterium]